jgi:hypothetical protein
MVGSRAFTASTRSWYFLRVASEGSVLKMFLKNALACTLRRLLARPGSAFAGATTPGALPALLH